MSTRLVHPPTAAHDPYGATAIPLYQTATFAQVRARPSIPARLEASM